MKTGERCFTEKIDKEMSNIVDRVESRIQNAILTSFDSFVASKSNYQLGQKTRPLVEMRPVSR